MSEEFAKDVIEGIWDSWYGELRGNANVDQMGDILEIAKQKIITKTRTTDTELTRLKRQVELFMAGLNTIAAWKEGSTVGPEFDAPASAAIARRALAAADRIAKGEV